MGLRPLLPEWWPEESLFFGLGIKVTDLGRHQLHTGAIYRSVDGRLLFGDLRWHLSVGSELALPDEGLYWLALDIDETTQRMLAAQIEAWLELNNGKIPYSATLSDAVKFRENIWVEAPPGVGLSCATFISELFKELLLPFIDTSSWQERLGDKEWAKEIIDFLRRSGASLDHVCAQYKAIGEMVRIRPSDIIAAGMLRNPRSTRGLRFDELRAVSMKIEEAMLACAVERGE